MDQEELEEDQVTKFLLYSHSVVQEARFLLEALPNVDDSAVERALHLLDGIEHILLEIEDPWIEDEDVESLVLLIQTIRSPLLAHLHKFSSEPHQGPSTLNKDSNRNHAGRPKTNLDLQHAVHLHNLGNTWKCIAEAIGVSRQTLYNHLHDADISSTRPSHSLITDEGLDKHVSELSNLHPLAGVTIMSGHLESRGILVSRKRVQDSLKRVDPVGVLLR